MDGPSGQDGGHTDGRKNGRKDTPRRKAQRWKEERGWKESMDGRIKFIKEVFKYNL